MEDMSECIGGSAYRCTHRGDILKSLGLYVLHVYTKNRRVLEDKTE